MYQQDFTFVHVLDFDELKELGVRNEAVNGIRTIRIQIHSKQPLKTIIRCSYVGFENIHPRFNLRVLKMYMQIKKKIYFIMQEQ